MRPTPRLKHLAELLADDWGFDLRSHRLLPWLLSSPRCSRRTRRTAIAWYFAGVRSDLAGDTIRNVEGTVLICRKLPETVLDADGGGTFQFLRGNVFGERSFQAPKEEVPREQRCASRVPSLGFQHVTSGSAGSMKRIFLRETRDQVWGNPVSACGASAVGSFARALRVDTDWSDRSDPGASTCRNARVRCLSRTAGGSPRDLSCPAG